MHEYTQFRCTHNLWCTLESSHLVHRDGFLFLNTSSISFRISWDKIHVRMSETAYTGRNRLKILRVGFMENPVFFPSGGPSRSRAPSRNTHGTWVQIRGIPPRSWDVFVPGWLRVKPVCFRSNPRFFNIPVTRTSKQNFIYLICPAASVPSEPHNLRSLPQWCHFARNPKQEWEW